MAGPLSIVHVSLTDDFGGAERYCVDLARRQHELGHRVALVARRPRAGQKDSLQRHAPRGVKLYTAGRYFPGAVIARALHEQSADIVNVHLHDSARAVVSVRSRPPTVLTLHLRFRPRHARRIEGLICVADWQMKETEAFAGPRAVAHNWPPDAIPVSAEDVEALRRNVSAGPGTTVVGFIGRLHRVKGVDLLINAYRRARAPNARLVIVGDGPERRALEHLAQGDPTVHFMGHRSDVDAWHRSIDLFVLPSRWEGLPLGPLEAMRAGTPILATASDGTAEVLAHTPATLVRPADQEALDRALESLLSRAAQGALPRLSYDLSDFDAGRSVQRIEEFYREVIAAREAHP